MILVDKVQVIDKSLRVIVEKDLPEVVHWVSGRSGIGESRLWYKGIGTLYYSHFANVADGYRVLNSATYGGYRVQYAPWVNRFGVFTERMQWYFSEWIGGAGKREGRIVENSEKFQLSAVKVIDVIPVVDDHNVYVLEVNGGKGICGDVGKILRLLEVMLGNGWNFPWDKGAIRDVNGEGLVTDVADLFRSNDVKCKFGTVYAILYSMRQLIPGLAKRFEEEVGVSLELKELPFSCLKVMKMLGCDISGLWHKKELEYSWGKYKKLVLDVLVDGVNCAGLEFSDFGDEVKKWYRNDFERRVRDASGGAVK